MDSEAELKKRFVDRMHKDFHIKEEIDGLHLIEKDPVRIDYILAPKKHLKEMGFPNIIFGVEVKYIKDFMRGDMGKKSRVVWQAITYSQSCFKINNLVFRPEFVLVYVGDNETNKNTNLPEHESEIRGATIWKTLMNIGQYANVGQLKLTKNHGWEIWFSGGRYFSELLGPGNLNLGNKRYIGSV